LLYWYRGRFRLSYGVVELGVGAALVVYSVVKQLPAGTLVESEVAGRVLQMAAGLYVMVRGLENIGKSLADKPSYAWWKKIFGTQ
jgi:Na+/H+ antiporter NhaD/arsenite permease-like protein